MRISPSIFLVLTAMISMLTSGCRDSDETLSPRYNFSSFSGTEWKTKVKIAVAEIKQGSTMISLIPPDSFDTNNPDYNPIAGCTVISVLPVGSRIRIARLMQDNVDWGGVRVTAVVEDSSVSHGTIHVEPGLLLNNSYLSYGGPSSSTNWIMKPDFFEKL
jgi:hypothetical protein